jgi:ABC-type transport system involved in multi-copper enzyme maturation permease subunit
MTAGPVIVRELREESRRPMTYGMRVVCALALGGPLFFVTRYPPGSWGQTDLPEAQRLGLVLFSALNVVLLATLTILVPMLMADAVSRERREGTLGLLFLTPLTARGIVLGKTVVHMLRGLSLYLTMAPWLMLPVLIGGVGWSEVSRAWLIHACVLLAGLSAGLLATSFARDRTRALIVAEVLGVLLTLAFATVHRAGLEDLVLNSSSWLTVWAGGPNGAGAAGAFWNTMPWAGPGPFVRLIELFGFTVNFGMVVVPTPGGGYTVETPWGGLLSFLGPSGPLIWMRWLTILFGVSLLGLFGAVQVAAWRVQRSWQELPPSRAQQELQEVFTKPRFWQGLFRSRLRRALERNPIGWLHQYSAGARLAKWGWCLVVVLVETMLVTGGYQLEFFRHFRAWQSYLTLALLAGLALSASTSFRRERESGAFELLLVTPLTCGQILSGRLRGIWNQFAPAVAVLLLCELTADRLWDRSDGLSQFAITTFGLLSYGTLLSVVGLYFSTFRLSVLAAWLSTLGVDLAVSGLGTQVGYISGGVPLRAGLGHNGTVLFVQLFEAWLALATAGVFARLLWHRLERRKIAMR